MCDPVKRPLTWNKKYYAYAEKHGIFEAFQELMRELAIWRPDDPLVFIEQEIERIGKNLYTPRVFMIGPEPLTPLLAENIANHCGAKYLTLGSIVEDTKPELRVHLDNYFKNQGSGGDEFGQKLLISVISRRLVSPDVLQTGYVLYGFPQNREQALMAQIAGLIPRQVFALLPEGPIKSSPPAPKPSASNVLLKTDTEIFTDLGKSESGEIKVIQSSSELQLFKDYFKVRDTVGIYNADRCKAKSYERWSCSDPFDLEAEFLGVLITKPNMSAPWIPRIVVMGPPCSGKRSCAEFLSKKLSIPCFGWTDIIRGALVFDDAVSTECTEYLETFAPISDDSVMALLKRRLYRDDCLKRGFVLYGFPETSAQCGALDKVALSPNRIFLLSCPEKISSERFSERRKEINSREPPEGLQKSSLGNQSMMSVMSFREKEGMGINPYSDLVFKGRMESYAANLDAILKYYGSSIIYVDATEDSKTVMDYIGTSAVKPPNIRFN